MDEDVIKQIQMRFEELPADVQKAVQSADVGEKLKAIADKHHLHIDQVEKLDDETRMVMLGMVDPDDFAAQIEQQVRVSAEEATAISVEISDQLFVPIRESMQQYMEDRILQNSLLQKPSASSEEAPAATSQKDLSVVMPSAVTPQEKTAPVPSMPAPAATLSTPTPSASPTVSPTPAAKPADMHEAELMLSEPTVSMPKPAAPPAPAPAVTPAAPSSPAPATPAPATPKAEAPKPAPYKADPYREPPE